MTQEYVVTNISKLAAYIDKWIGLDFELTKLDGQPNAGSIVVFDISSSEHKQLRHFITEHNYWYEHRY